MDQRADIPETVRIGALDFNIVVREDLYSEGRLTAGLIRQNTGEIELYANATPQYARIVLWHEILHGLLHQAGVSEHPEQLLDIIASGIVQVLRDNPILRDHGVLQKDQTGPEAEGPAGACNATEAPGTYL